MATYVPAKINTEFIFYASVVSQANTKIMQVNPTIAAGDFKVSTNGGALGNLTTIPAVTPASSAMIKFTLSAAEMNGDNVTVVGIDAAGSEWCDLVVNIQTAANQVDDVATLVTTVDTVVDGIQTDLDNATDGLGAIKAETALIVADTNELQTDWTNAGRLDTILDELTTNVDAIEADTQDLQTQVGTAGAGLTNITLANDLSATMKTSVQTAADAALVAQNLDHLVKIAVDTNFATTVHLDSVVGQLADPGTTATFDRTTDSLEAVRNHIGDGTNLTEAGGTGDHLTAINLPNQTMDITGNLSGSVGSVVGHTAQTGDTYALAAGATGFTAIDTVVDSVKVVTDQFVFTTANQVDAQMITVATGAIGTGDIAAAALNEIADAILDRNMTTGTDSGSPTVRTVRQALRASRNKVAIVAGTATVYKEDDTTASWTAAVTTTAGDPISAVDPADA